MTASRPGLVVDGLFFATVFTVTFCFVSTIPMSVEIVSPVLVDVKRRPITFPARRMVLKPSVMVM